MAISCLSEELNHWYEANCNKGDLAWSYLARKTQVSVSQLCKIAKGQVSRPKYHTVKSILEAIYPNDHSAVYKYLVEHFPKNQIHLTCLTESKRSTFEESARHLLKDRMTFRLFKLAATNRFTVEGLKAEFGSEMILPRLDALSLAGLVEVAENGVVSRTSKHSDTAMTKFADVADEFQHAIEILAAKKLVASVSDHEIDQIFNRLTFFHHSFNQEALEEMSDDITKFVESFIEKYEAEKYRGDIPGFLNIATGRFDSK